METYKWLIETNAQDPSGNDHTAIYRNTKQERVIVATLSILIVLFTIVTLTNKSSASAIADQSAKTNSQKLALLSSPAEVDPRAVGGPAEAKIDNKLALLLPQTTINHNNDVALKNIEVNSDGIILYTVHEGDTLSEIAEYFDVSTNTIRWENNINGNTIKKGQELKILPITGVRHTIKSGDTLTKIAKEYGVDPLDIAIYNYQEIETLSTQAELGSAKSTDVNEAVKNVKLKTGEKIIIPNGVKKAPVQSTSGAKSSNSNTSSSSSSSQNNGFYARPAKGVVTSLMGARWGRYHYGIDFGGNIGDPIYATASGTVKQIGCGTGYGKCLIIQHSNGTESLYAHTSEILVSSGAKVKQGDLIAKIGNTGNVTGPHLHFEVRDSNSGQRKNMNYMK
ncbi:MAG: peptidoglycan DD-metalloendopeptidase family protein [Candidatus Pacebacteria bacterium]|nr:peptidoglycan DD-metalloendopeptidase family protein [Candidatus Paceibacterota bacterium]